MVESIEIHDKLNPVIWNPDATMKPEVEEKLLGVVSEFSEYVAIPLMIVDIELVGSNASFNYTSQSDIDLHIITNFEQYNAAPEIMQAYYNSEKTRFNTNYDISIKSHPVEIYVEDINTTAISNGIYSLMQHRWIRVPKELRVDVEFDSEPSLARWQKRVDQAIATGNKEEIDRQINVLYLMRKNSLACDGEFGIGNLIFKAVRNAGLLDKLKDASRKCKAKQLSIESLVEGTNNSAQAIYTLN